MAIAIASWHDYGAHVPKDQAQGTMVNHVALEDSSVGFSHSHVRASDLRR